MPEQITLPVNKGAVTGMDPSLLKPGHLQEAVGVVYSPSDPAARKYPGRILEGTVAASAATDGIEFIDFDAATDRIIDKIGTVVYSADPSTGVFSSIRTGLTAGALTDGTMSPNNQFFMCDGTDTNWVVKSDNSTIRVGLNQVVSAGTILLAGVGITGTFTYWMTEYDSVNAIESAASPLATVSTSPANQAVSFSRPALINPSADKWRLYRTINNGKYPLGWRISEQLAVTPSAADAASDASIVLLPAYNIVTLNGVSESQDTPPPALRSMCFFDGSLMGVHDRSFAYSESLAYHSFPVDYDIPLPPRFGGAARCVRRVGRSALVFFDHDCFRVNYLPKAADSSFDKGVCWDHIGNYGTPSPKGAVMFSGWGGEEMCIFASSATIMLTDGNAFDQAVTNIDWAATVPQSALSTCVLIDDPANLRVRMFFNASAADTTVWKELHFYYDASRIGTASGFPELAWTGPHLSPGPGTFGVVSGVGTVYTASKKTDGKVYQEGSGTSDAANLSSLGAGIVEFALKVPIVYPKGIGGQATCERVFLHKASAGTGNYTCTMSCGNDEDQARDYAHSIDASKTGSSSNDFHASGQSFTFRVQRNDAAAMPNINSVILTFDDLADEWAKTVRR